MPARENIHIFTQVFDWSAQLHVWWLENTLLGEY